ncbi:hypothetical protein [Brevibacillus choshinensis]|uniref:hypothetical protein n=1 Tax=Brevibacillus choshinensis TaxID=54911 RepID=UPI002E1AF90A|nr:hypothetical protein [Brevibacillus choshinensis]
MSNLNILLISLMAIGIFFIWFGGINIFQSKRQLRKQADFEALKRKFDGHFFQMIEDQENSFLKRQIKKLDQWSEIGKGEKLSLYTFTVRSLFLSTVFAVLTWLFTSSPMMLLCGFVIGFLFPLLMLRASYLRVTHRARRLGLLPYIDVYKNSYLAASQNVISAFHVSEQDCPKEMKPILEWLLRRLHDGSPQKEGLREFAVILHSEWAQVFVNYCISGLEGEAENIARSLSQLQIEMHGMRDEEEERELVTKAAFYANFGIIGLTLLCIFFLAILMPQVKRFFIQQDEGHILLAIAVWTWMITIIYNYFRLKGGDT